MSTVRWKSDGFANFDTAGDLTGEAGLSTVPDAIAFNAGGGFGNAGSAARVAAKGPKLTTLVKFAGADGSGPYGSLITDAAGNLYGTADASGSDASGDGAVFEIAKTKSGYASKPTTLVSFTGANGAEPDGGLIADAAGDLFSSTDEGGAENYGTVFEITNSGFVPPTSPVAPADAHITHPSPPGAAFVQAMASFGASRSGDTTPTFLASRHETSMQLSLPHQVA